MANDSLPGRARSERDHRLTVARAQARVVRLDRWPSRRVELAVVRGHGVVRGALEHEQLVGLLGDDRDRLDSRRAGADDADALAAEVDTFVGPLAGVIRLRPSNVSRPSKSGTLVDDRQPVAMMKNWARYSSPRSVLTVQRPLASSNVAAHDSWCRTGCRGEGRSGRRHVRGSAGSRAGSRSARTTPTPAGARRRSRRSTPCSRRRSVRRDSGSSTRCPRRRRRPRTPASTGPTRACGAAGRARRNLRRPRRRRRLAARSCAREPRSGSMRSVEPDSEPEGDPFAQMDPEMAANPQPMFKVIRATDPVMAVEGVGVVLARKAEIDEAFRHPEIFSSNMSAVDLKNIRPLIPLQIDPPDHKEFRKILDPIFAPRADGAARGAAHRARQRPDRRLRRSRRDRLRRRVLGAVPVAGVPHPARPPARRAAPVPGHEGRDHPARPGPASREWGSDEMHEYQRATATSIYDYFDGVLDERDGGASRRPAVAFPRRPRSTARSSRARTSSTSASCSSSPGSTR